MTLAGQEASPPTPDVACFVDEAGERGYLRNLKPEQDHCISLLCALPIPAEHLDFVRLEIKPLFDRFVAAAPSGAKHHITDAFRPGNETWAKVARVVRDDIFDLILHRQLRVVYAARRFKIAREMYIAAQGMKPPKQTSPQPKQYEAPGANRPSDEQVDDQVMIDLSLMLDGFMENAERHVADFAFDEIDASVADRYTRMLERTRNVSYRRKDVKARNLQTGKDEVRIIEMCAKADFRLDTAHLGSIEVAGKSDPLVFATDVVANSLWRHLASLPPDAPLNDSTAVASWKLQPITWVSPIPSVMDKI